MERPLKLVIEIKIGEDGAERYGQMRTAVRDGLGFAQDHLTGRTPRIGDTGVFHIKDKRIGTWRVVEG